MGFEGGGGEREREPESCPTNAHCCIKRANTNAANPKKKKPKKVNPHTTKTPENFS